MKDTISRLRTLMRSQTLTESEVHDLGRLINFAEVSLNRVEAERLMTKAAGAVQMGSSMLSNLAGES